MAVNGLAIMAVPVVSLAIAPLLARALGVSGRGEYASVTAILFLAVSLAGGGFVEAMTFHLVRLRASGKRILVLAGLGVLALSAICTVVVLLLKPALTSSASTETLIAYSALAIFPSALVTIGRGYAAANRAWGRVNAERYMGAVMRLVGIVALFVANLLSVTSAVIVIVTSTILPGIVYLFPMSRGAVGTSLDKAGPAFDFYRLAGVNWTATLSLVLLVRFDQASLGALTSAEQLGLYAVAAAIAEVPQLGLWAVREVMLSHDAHEQDSDALLRVCRFSVFVMGAMLILVGLSVVWLVPLLFGGEYKGAIPMIQVLLIAVLLVTPGNILASALVARGMARSRAYIAGISLVVNAASLFLFAPTLGGLGAALAMVTSSAVSTSLYIRTFRRIHAASWRSVVFLNRSDARVVIGATRAAWSIVGRRRVHRT